MKILLLLSESWNDKAAPNNNMTNWFSGFPNAEIWTISGSSQLPDNKCCDNYFLIGENQMIRSLFSKEKAGKRYILERTNEPRETADLSETDISDNQKVKRLFAGECARLARDFVWRFGRYDFDEMKRFVEDFNPDIVFSQRRGSVKMCRLEATVSAITKAPMVAYTGDDEYSLHQVSFSPVFWIRRFWTRAWLKRTIPQYRLFYSQSDRQMQEFKREFGVKMKFLVKCGEFDNVKVHRSVNQTIQMVYAGKLYCNRWKTLGIIADAIRTVNEANGSTKIQLNIYTGDTVTPAQNRLLNDGNNSIIRGRIPAERFPDVYKQSDIVLHVEGMDVKNRLLTQDSFSTKVMDCLSSGCAVMVVCWEGHAAYQYLQRKDAALLVSSADGIYRCIESIVAEPAVVCEYAMKAHQCGEQNHQRGYIQKMIYEDFDKVIKEC